MTSYLFSFGNSTVGPIGMCIRVLAEDKETALKRARHAMREVAYECWGRDFTPDVSDQQHIGYVSLYLNADALTLDDIEDCEEAADAP